MNAVFLSASVPRIGRGSYHETANPFLIQCAVRELVMAVLGKRLIVWGGHPAITPMIWAICHDLKIEYSKSVVLYQSKFFEHEFPAENDRFGEVVLVDAVAGDRDASLRQMRTAMLSRRDLRAAVFIGGMDGVEIEHLMFRKFHPRAKVIPVASTGGAALQLAQHANVDQARLRDVDFARMFHAELRLRPRQRRD